MLRDTLLSGQLSDEIRVKGSPELLRGTRMKTATALGRLLRADLREVFTTEAGHFTPWLA